MMTKACEIERRMVMLTPKNTEKRMKNHSVRSLCIMKATDVSKKCMLVVLKHTTPSLYLKALQVSHVDTFFTPFTALLETLLFINSEFKGGGGVFKVSVKMWQLIS